MRMTPGIRDLLGKWLLASSILILAGCDQGTLERRGAPGPSFFEPYYTDRILDIEEVSPGQLLAVGRGGGILRSTDDGSSWSRINIRVSGDLYDVAVHPKTSTAVAVGDNGLIVRSTDLGLTWSTVSAGTDVTLRRVVSHQETGALVAIGALGTALRSEDRGATWTGSATGTAQDLRHIAAGGPSGRTLIAASELGTLVRSEDFGNRWTTVRQSAAAPKAVWSTGQDGSVGLWNGGLFRSTHGGRTWMAIRSIFADQDEVDRDVQCLAVTPRENAIFAVGEIGKFVRSEDRGVTWSQIGLRFEVVECVAANEESGTLVAIGSEGGVARSTDDGKTWTYHDIPWKASASNHSIQFDPTSGSFVVFNGDKTAIGSNDGTRWQVHSPQETIQRLYVHENGNDIIGEGFGSYFRHESSDRWQLVENRVVDELMSGVDRGLYYVAADDAVLSSHDDGQTWTLHEAENNVDVLSHRESRSLFALRATAIVQSRDHGKTWQEIHRIEEGSSDGLIELRSGGIAAVGSLTTLVLRKGDEGYVTTTHELDDAHDEFGILYSLSSGALLATGDDGEIFRSSDNGKSWTERSTHLARALIELVRVDRDTVLGVDHENNVVRSTNAGATFGTRGFRASFLRTLTLNPKTGVAFSAGGDVDRVGRSSDFGATWKACACRGLGADAAYVTSIRFHAASGAFVAVGWGPNSRMNVWRSTDDGETWTTVDLETGSLRAMTITAEGHLIAVGDGVLVSDDGGLTWDRSLGTNYDLNGVGYSRDAAALLAAGDDGVIVRSTDAGKTWSTSRTGTDNDLENVSWVRGCACVLAVGKNGTVLRSDNDGQSWFAVEGLNPEHDFVDIAASFDSDPIYVVGRYDAALRLTPSRPYPYVTAVKYSGLVDGSIRLDVSISDAAQCGDGCVRLLGLNNADFKRDRPFRSGLPQARRIDTTRWQFDLDPRAELSAAEGETLHFAFELSGENFYWRQPADGGAFSFQYAVDPTLRNTAIIVAMYLFSAAGLYAFWPGALTNVARHFGKVQAFGGLHPSLDVVVAIVSRVTVLPWLAALPRTLDHWIAQHGAALFATLEHRTRMASSEEYFPLPVRLALTNETVLPSAQTFGPVFSGRKCILNLLGPGGAGKTTLARQLSRWASSRAMFPFTSAVLWVDDEVDDPESYLLHYVRMAAGDPTLPESVIHALFRHRRLLLVLDRLSERSIATQERWRSQFPHFVSACVVTSRAEFATDFARSEIAELSPLDASNLTGFLDHLLRTAGLHIEGLAARAELLSRLSKTIRVGSAEMKVTPLLAKLFVKSAVSASANGQLQSSHLPASIPEVFFRYLTQLNPAETTAANYLSTHEMYQVTRTLAALEISASYAPRSVRVAEAQRELEALLPALYERRCDPIQRLRDNQVLHIHESLGEEWLRFELDPVAEYVAAAELADRCGADVEKWMALIQKLESLGEGARGFRSALYVTYSTYRIERGWPVSIAERLQKSDSHTD